MINHNSGAIYSRLGQQYTRRIAAIFSLFRPPSIITGDAANRPHPPLPAAAAARLGPRPDVLPLRPRVGLRPPLRGLQRQRPRLPGRVPARPARVQEGLAQPANAREFNGER